MTQQLINSGRGTEEYESGNTIRLSATPESDFLFYNWGYLRNNTNENNYENPLEVKMDRSKTVTATFEQKLPIINPDNTDKNNTVGKWKIRKKGPGTRRFSDRAVNCELNEIIIRSDNSFTIITETSTITGQYTIDSDTSISLNQGGKTIGSLTELVLTENFISFNINLIEVCDEQLEADKDPTYDEATDPIAPSNSGTTSSTGGENNSETTTSTTSSDTTNTGTTTSTSGNGGSNTGTTSSTGGGGNNSGNSSSTSANISQEPLSFNIQVLLFENNSSDYRVLLNEDRLGGLNGDADPDLDFYIGDSISFEIDTPGHPFYLKTIQGTGTEDLINGVSNNGATSGTISWTPTTTGTYYYQCSIHNGMYGTITVN